MLRSGRFVEDFVCRIAWERCQPDWICMQICYRKLMSFVSTIPNSLWTCGISKKFSVLAHAVKKAAEESAKEKKGN